MTEPELRVLFNQTSFQQAVLNRASWPTGSVAVKSSSALYNLQEAAAAPTSLSHTWNDRTQEKWRSHLLSWNYKEIHFDFWLCACAFNTLTTIFCSSIRKARLILEKKRKTTLGYMSTYWSINTKIRQITISFAISHIHCTCGVSSTVT